MVKESVSIIPAAGIELLRCHRAASGFRNVYRSGSGFVAKIREGGVLLTILGSQSGQAHQAARHVIEWYQTRFGEGWKVAIENRMRRYWRVRKSTRFGGWILTAWVDGVAACVRSRDARGRAQDTPLVFESRIRAVAYAMFHLHRHHQSEPNWAAWRA